MRRTLLAPALLLLLSCGEAEPPAPPAPVPAPASAEEPGLSPNARPELVQMLRDDRAAERHASDGGGRAWLEAAPEAVVAGQPGRFEIVFETGSEGIAEGGRVFLVVPAFWHWSPIQLFDSGAPGYTEFSSAAEGVELAPELVDSQTLALAVAGRALEPGEQIRFVYGAGSVGAFADSYAERGERFRLAVDGDGDGVRAFVADPPSVDVGPGPPAQLVLHLPATGRPGEPALLTAAVLDARASAGIPYRGELRVEPRGFRLDAPADPNGIVRLRFESADGGRLQVPVVPSAPGVLRVRARSGPFEAESGPMLVAEAAPRILWGDLHGHSQLSDGTGTAEDYYRYARDFAALDVSVLTDHDHWGVPFLDETPAMWERVRAAVLRHHEPGRFVTLLGFEWTNWLHGHRHVLYFDDDGEVLSSIDPELDTPAELWDRLRGRAALTFAHHSAGGPVATNWNYRPDPELEPVTEIVSVHGASEALDAPRAIYGAIPGNFVRDVVARGDRLGFVGSGDGHDGHPGHTHLAGGSGGLAGILSEARTREGVLEALRARRVYATNGPRIVLHAHLGERPMGSVVPPGDHRLRFQVSAVAPLERIELVRVGGRPFPADVALLFDPAGERDVAFEEPVQGLEAGERVYLRALQRDGGAAWSSPFFVE